MKNTKTTSRGIQASKIRHGTTSRTHFQGALVQEMTNPEGKSLSLMLQKLCLFPSASAFHS